MKLSDYVWQMIADQGVKHVFMFPGGQAMHLVDSLGNNDRIEHITMLHEQACSFAAETYARVSDNLGVALTTSGPGATNAVTGCAAAWLESTPMVFISGQVKTADLKTGFGVRQRGDQEIGIVDIVSSITKRAVLLDDPNNVRYELEKALYCAREGRPGPVWLDIPLDVQAAEIQPEELRGFSAPASPMLHPSSEQIRHVVQLLREARRPVLYGGQGIERNGGRTDFRTLVDRLGIPVQTTWMAAELLGSEHPLHMGKPGMVAHYYSNYVIQNADLVIAVGTRLNAPLIGFDQSKFAPGAKKVVVDIDQAELDKFDFPTEESICCDATCFIRDLVHALSEENFSVDIEPWIEQCSEWRKTCFMDPHDVPLDACGINPYYFISVLSDCLDDDEVVIPGSSGAGIDIFWLMFKNRMNQRVLGTGAIGSMGYGIPAAIGACAATGRRVVSVEGDGSLQLNIQELATIKGLNLPIKMFIFDNKGYLAIMNTQRNHFGAHFVGANKSSGLCIPDIASVAKGYGLPVTVLESDDNLKDGINAVLGTMGPALCVLKMSDATAIQPKVVSKMLLDGKMVSGSLEELAPQVAWT